MLGRGGMGTVYLARDRRHGRLVAIKTVHSHVPAKVGLPRFQREIQITARLQHPYILPLLDSGIAADTLFYVMPYVEGESLADRLSREGALPVDDVLRIAGDVLEALEYAHGRGVIHRDIKPGNILLGEQRAMIVDFGIAKALSGGEDHSLEDHALTATGAGVGSPNYMAPEQFVGKAAPTSDLYAVGAVVYESLTGVCWAATESTGEARWSRIPRSLRGVIRRALERDPDQRWPDAQAFRRALRASRKPRARRATVIGISTALVIAAAGWGVASLWRPGNTPTVDRASRSIAVLPLENLSGDEETEYFSDGITEDIITQLSKISDLNVISRTSVMQYKQTVKTIREIGHELNVSTVLDGSVRRDGDRVRIVSQLIEATTNDLLWAERYDRELTDVFAIQSDVAQRIAEALQATISPRERSLIERRPTEDVEAHNLYLRGRYLWNRRTRAGLESGADYFRQATERDPEYAPAFAGLADAYLLLGSYQYMPEREATQQARGALERALQLDDDLAEAHASRGQVLRAERDWVGEEQAYLRAIELNPSYSTAHQWYATLLAALGRREEAIREAELARSLDPLSHAIGVTAGVVHFVNRDYEGAIERLENTLELEPSYFSAHVWLSMSYSEMGRTAEALQAYEKLVELRPDIPQWGFFLANVYARSGQTELARETLARVTEEADDLTLSAWVHASLGERDRALDLLEQAFEDDSWTMFVFFRNFLFYLDEGPWFDPLRADPRFGALVEQMRLP